MTAAAWRQRSFRAWRRYTSSEGSQPTVARIFSLTSRPLPIGLSPMTSHLMTSAACSPLREVPASRSLWCTPTKVIISFIVMTMRNRHSILALHFEPPCFVPKQELRRSSSWLSTLWSLCDRLAIAQVVIFWLRVMILIADGYGKMQTKGLWKRLIGCLLA